MGKPYIAEPDSQSDAPPDAIILAAGKGKRMNADRPKILFEVAGRPMLWWVVKACHDASVDRCIVVVSRDDRPVRAVLADLKPCQFVVQDRPLGTGHAARAAESCFASLPPRDVFVLGGDGPLIRAATLRRLLQVHRERSAAVTLATAVLADPTGYGRILRDAGGGFSAIIEQKDAHGGQLQVREVNPSYYCFRSDRLFAALAAVQNDNSQGEYYLTDVPALLKNRQSRIALLDEVPAQDVMSINTPEQLEAVDAILRRRVGEISE